MQVPVEVVVGVLGERGVGQEALELVHDVGPRHGALLLVAAQGAQADVPSASSWGPTTSATRAPERSADLIWDFIERPSKARSARRPARRSSAVRTTAASPPAVSIT